MLAVLVHYVLWCVPDIMFYMRCRVYKEGSVSATYSPPILPNVLVKKKKKKKRKHPSDKLNPLTSYHNAWTGFTRKLYKSKKTLLNAIIVLIGVFAFNTTFTTRLLWFCSVPCYRFFVSFFFLHALLLMLLTAHALDMIKCCITVD